jgi:hypothetical protein
MKKNVLTIITAMVVFLNVTFAQEPDNKYQPFVLDFINCIKTDNANELAKFFDFPLGREYPVPSIKNKEDFKLRYKEIFDDSLKQMIINSNPKKDWSEVGWRGIMLNSGVLFLSSEGKIWSINYKSKAENQIREKYIAEDKKNVHPSLLPFEYPVHLLETKDYRIRIDALGNEKYRFALWNKKLKMSEKPELLINDGQIVYEGTSSNHSYQFKKEGKIYKCEIIHIGAENTPPAIYSILKAEKEVFSQDAIIISN